MRLENIMDDNELAEAIRSNLEQLHAKIADLQEGQRKRRWAKFAKLAHGALEQIHDEAVDEGMVAPFSGPIPKGP